MQPPNLKETRFPVFVNGNISLAHLTAALRDAGFTIKSDIAGRMVVDEVTVPGFLRKDDNVVQMKKGKQR